MVNISNKIAMILIGGYWWLLVNNQRMIIKIPQLFVDSWKLFCHRVKQTNKLKSESTGMKTFYKML